jgi:hypothetical protein
VFLLEVIQTTDVPALMQKNWLPFASGTPGLTEAPSPDFLTSIVHTADADPQVLAAVHLSSGFGSSQMYLLFAWVSVLPSKRTVDANTTLQGRSCLLMVNTSLGI